MNPDRQQIPDELDLALRQKFFVTRALIEQYREGARELAKMTKRRAKRYRKHVSQTDAVQIAYVQGWMDSARTMRDWIAGADWEDMILEAQAEILGEHGEDDDEEE